ncbi:MAG: hypothetical protein HC780_12760 [Leptolyngbyaceae cyanobacterium CSU_1_3]|nr:hypothetical protein [Leptolyngbyaceae cyanobacterium CSU_1_3]
MSNKAIGENWHLLRAVFGGCMVLGSLAIAPALAAPTAQKTQPTISPPYPDQQFVPQARVALTGDRINVMLRNNTYASITYQVIGDTKPRTLAGRSTVMLQRLKMPLTLTLDRQDAGLLKVTSKVMAKMDNTVEFGLDTTTDLSTDATTLRIEKTGSVFIY